MGGGECGARLPSPRLVLWALVLWARAATTIGYGCRYLTCGWAVEVGVDRCGYRRVGAFVAIVRHR